jgi:hypothetical protein
MTVILMSMRQMKVGVQFSAAMVRTDKFEAAQVVPLQALGDIGATSVGDNEILAHALANMSSKALESAYTVKWSGQFVNEYLQIDATGQCTGEGPDDPNDFLGEFPTLYCYGKGGPEVNRPIDVPYNVHIRAALQHYNKRFTLHLQFIFQAFGILQKRQI